MKQIFMPLGLSLLLVVSACGDSDGVADDSTDASDDSTDTSDDSLDTSDDSTDTSEDPTGGYNCYDELCFELIDEVPVGPGARDLDLFDCDDDGLLDLVTANSDAGTLSISRGHGDGSFAFQQTTDASLDPWVLAPADFNDDGIVDVAIANFINGAGFVLGEGDCTFGPWTLLSEGTVVAIDAADINKDGIADIAIEKHSANANGDILSIVHGSSAFPMGLSSESYPVNSGASDLQIRDIDGDGNVDIAGVTTWLDFGANFELQVLRGLSEGGFAPVVGYTVVDAPHTLAIADFDGDGLEDVVTAGSENVSLLRGVGDAEFLAHVTFGLGTVDVVGVAAGDLNRDGFDDVVAALGDRNQVAVLLGAPSGALGEPLVFEVDAIIGSDWTPNYVEVVDVNDDTWPDVLTTNYTGSVSVLLNISGPSEGYDPVHILR